MIIHLNKFCPQIPKASHVPKKYVSLTSTQIHLKKITTTLFCNISGGLIIRHDNALTNKYLALSYFISEWCYVEIIVFNGYGFNLQQNSQKIARIVAISLFVKTLRCQQKRRHVQLL